MGFLTMKEWKENVKKSMITGYGYNEEIEKQADDEYVWIDGYKGTDENMCCKRMQYELNKEHICIGDTELCKQGFHFCTVLSNVFNYYSWNFKNRFFKVKALVRKKDIRMPSDKYVAQKIIFVEEIHPSYETLVQIGALTIGHFCTMPEELFLQKSAYYEQDSADFVWFSKEMKKLGYSEVLIRLLLPTDSLWFEYVYVYNVAEMCKAEKLSPDMSVYYIMEARKEFARG